MVLDSELVEELKEAYNTVASQSAVTKDNLGQVFKEAGEAVPSFKIRDICENMNKGGGQEISMDEFIAIFEKLGLNKAKGSQLKKVVQKKTGVQQVPATEQTSSGTIHSVTDAERSSFSHFVNTHLQDDPDCRSLLPLDPNSDDLFKKLENGILLCKMVNIAVPGTIDERAICKEKLNSFTAHENLTLGLNSCRSIGICLVNIGQGDIRDGTVHIVLGLVWQLLRKYFMAPLSLVITPELMCLMREGETTEEFNALSPEELLMRWVEYQIRKVGCTRSVTNLGRDLSDCEVYAALETAVMPETLVHTQSAILSQGDNLGRAKMVLDNSTAAGIPKLVSPYDIASGNAKLNSLYIAEMFKNYPCLEPVEAAPEIEETREERSYRNWMNSLGVTPTVYYLYFNLADGLVLLQLCDKITPGSVNWDKVNRPPYKANQALVKKVENCNQVVEIAKRFGLHVKNLAGKDITEGAKIFVLGLVFQLMRMYTLQLLSKLSQSTKPLTDQDILDWVNEKFSETGKPLQISSFKDPHVLTSHAVFHLVDAIKSGSVDWSLVNDGTTEEDRMSNAKLAVSLSRKIGAVVYALPEDIVEGKSKMVMTVFACLMVVAYSK